MKWLLIFALIALIANSPTRAADEAEDEVPEPSTKSDNVEEEEKSADKPTKSKKVEEDKKPAGKPTKSKKVEKDEKHADKPTKSKKGEEDEKPTENPTESNNNEEEDEVEKVEDDGVQKEEEEEEDEKVEESSDNSKPSSTWAAKIASAQILEYDSDYFDKWEFALKYDSDSHNIFNLSYTILDDLPTSAVIEVKIYGETSDRTWESIGPDDIKFAVSEKDSDYYELLPEKLIKDIESEKGLEAKTYTYEDFGFFKFGSLLKEEELDYSAYSMTFSFMSSDGKTLLSMSHVLLPAK